MTNFNYVLIIIHIGAPVVSFNFTDSVIGVAGRSITLTFNITEDNPTVLPNDIQWLFNGTELMIPASRGSFSRNRHSLTIHNLSLTDEGTYTLVAINPAGTSQASLYLDVEGMWAFKCIYMKWLLSTKLSLYCLYNVI